MALAASFCWMIYRNYQYRSTCQSYDGTGCTSDVDALYSTTLSSTQQDQFYAVMPGSINNDLFYNPSFNFY
jgi:hypothetical protein